MTKPPVHFEQEAVDPKSTTVSPAETLPKSTEDGGEDRGVRGLDRGDIASQRALGCCIDRTALGIQSLRTVGPFYDSRLEVRISDFLCSEIADVLGQGNSLLELLAGTRLESLCLSHSQ